MDGSSGDGGAGRIVCIYCLRHPRTARIVYVGRAIDPRARYRQHLREASSVKSAKATWLLSLGKEMPSLSILEEVPEAEAIEAEQRWIAKVLAGGTRLVNGTHNPPKPKHLDSDLLSVSRAAEEKGVNAATIRRACVDGKLRCVKLGERAWAVRWRDLESWTRSARGRKKRDE